MPKQASKLPKVMVFLGAKASRYLGDARFLLSRICEDCDDVTAEYIFTTCIAELEKQQAARATAVQKAKAQAARSLATLPTIAQIAVADRKQIENWWARLPDRTPSPIS
jgi:hypothetical protein